MTEKRTSSGFGGITAREGCWNRATGRTKSRMNENQSLRLIGTRGRFISQGRGHKLKRSAFWGGETAVERSSRHVEGGKGGLSKLGGGKREHENLTKGGEETLRVNRGL